METPEEYHSIKNRLNEAIHNSCLWEDDLEKQFNRVDVGQLSSHSFGKITAFRF